MKTIFNILLFYGFIVLTAFSCEKENSKTVCIEGNVIGYEQCEKATLIEVKSFANMGKTITYYEVGKEDTVYNNVIKSPGLYPKGKIYFTYREYNSDIDYKLFLYDPPQACPQNIIPYDATIYVITNYSQTNCQEVK